VNGRNKKNGLSEVFSFSNVREGYPEIVTNLLCVYRHIRLHFRIIMTMVGLLTYRAIQYLSYLDANTTKVITLLSRFNGNPCIEAYISSNFIIELLISFPLHKRLQPGLLRLPLREFNVQLSM
jgi:hypothetical protein